MPPSGIKHIEPSQKPRHPHPPPPPPPRRIASSLQQTPWLRSTSSFTNSSENRRYVDDILKEELGTMYVGLPGFRDAYFGRLDGLEAASKEVFDQGLDGREPVFRNGWKDGPGIRTKKASQKSNTAHQRSLLIQPKTPMPSSATDHKLDVRFVDDLKGPPYHWKQILVPRELKSNPSADTASKARIDLGRYAREVLAAQDTRRFVMGFTLCGSLMRVWAFDRLGALASEQFDINKDGLEFVSVIQRNGLKEQIVIDGVILRARCVAGRAVTCWKAHPKGHPETPLVIKVSWQYPERDEEGDLLREVTDKGIVNAARYYHHETVRVHETDDDIWNNVRHGLDITAATNYRAGRQISPRKVVKDSPRNSRPCSSKKRHSSQLDSALPPSKRSCSMSPIKVASTPPNRVHRRIILRDYGKPIYEASSRSALLAALVCCIDAHESLYKAGILHRDVSINNLMINEDSHNPSWPSFLIDLDLAIREPREGISGAKGKTGTRAFMAVGAPLGEQHSFTHDLESFFWVVFWICVHHEVNGKEVGPTGFDRWNYESDNTLAELKMGVVADEQYFLQKLTESFTSQYQPLVPWVNKLRREVFPSGRKWNRSEPGLYSFMRQVLDDAQKDPEGLANTQCHMRPYTDRSFVLPCQQLPSASPEVDETQIAHQKLMRPVAFSPFEKSVDGLRSLQTIISDMGEDDDPEDASKQAKALLQSIILLVSIIRRRLCGISKEGSEGAHNLD
ncbi:hypothetical protein CCUS01_11237 [Colletotrichum cuscutae]|uniref:non-specific serine/threonine protein kinase n=1 Tax=Colletotrichum cuscutae TaxID=1209917 RepID=A0AAI9XJA7_9PEZI|nr:hypothetical protein CCUS01_11237 [Colletotrichum cuscutae]